MTCPESDQADAGDAVAMCSDSASGLENDMEEEEDDDDTFYSIISSGSDQQEILTVLRPRQHQVSRDGGSMYGPSKHYTETKTASSEGHMSKSQGTGFPGVKDVSDPSQGSVGDAVANYLAQLSLKDSPLNTPQDPASPKATALPLTPPRQGKQTLISPKKLPSLPQTPHRPGMDLFWDQDFVSEWNEKCSPKRLVLPTPAKSPAKSLKLGQRKPDKTRVTKKAFEQSRHQLAEAFLAELDETILQGQLRELASSTGGVKIEWSKKLNTTAGRANWRKETLRNRSAGNTESAISCRHHASIELAEKVIDDEDRLLNVIAHEFCHLANFMVSGITGSPHGKEFKAWATQVSNIFKDRGVEVTTKHSYDIDFKYVWTCTTCATDFKRHSRSINTERHRCGACRGPLQQTKPIPRNTNGKKSKYQQFVQEQMPIVKRENPGSPQKGMMRLVAQKWAHRTTATAGSDSLEVPRVPDEG
ncbi:hypothetical protein ACHAQH_009605 [Verticillium albo-atrum]